MGKINKQGFTIIELLVSVSVMALFSLTVISVFLAAVRGSTKSQLLQKIHQDGDFALESMVRTIRLADEIENCDSLPHPTLLMTDIYEQTAEYALQTDEGVDKIASTSGTVVQHLTGNLATVSSLEFTCSNSELGNQVVTIEFLMTAGSADSQIQEKYAQEFATAVATRTY